MTPSQTASVRKVVAGLLLGVGSSVVVWLLTIVGWIEPLELNSYDWRIRHAVTAPPSVNPDIVMVGISDTSIRDLAPFFGRWPWPRLGIAAMVDFLNRAPAKVIAIDVTFLEPQHNLSFTLGNDGPVYTGDQSDTMLAEAIRKRPNVILLADAVYGGVNGATQVNAPAVWHGVPYRLGPAIEERPLVVPPFQSLTDAAAGLAHNFLALDADGPARRVPPFIRSGDRYLPNLGVAAALMALGTKPEDVVLQRRPTRDWRPIRPAHRDQSGRRVGQPPDARSADDADQLSGAGTGRRAVALHDVRSAAPARRRGSTAARRSAGPGPGGLQGQDRLHRPDCLRAGRRVPDAVRQEPDAGHPAACEHRRQRPFEPLHPAGAAADRDDRRSSGRPRLRC